MRAWDLMRLAISINALSFRRRARDSAVTGARDSELGGIDFKDSAPKYFSLVHFFLCFRPQEVRFASVGLAVGSFDQEFSAGSGSSHGIALSVHAFDWLAKFELQHAEQHGICFDFKRVDSCLEDFDFKGQHFRSEGY